MHFNRLTTSRPVFFQTLLLISFLLLADCTVSHRRDQASPVAARETAKEASIAERLGIEVVALRLTSAGTMLDFRYRVVNSRRASDILSKSAKPYLLDPATGTRLTTPSPAYVGPLRQTSVTPEAGKTYFIFFGNPGRLLKKGCLVTLVLGDTRLDGLEIM